MPQCSVSDDHRSYKSDAVTLTLSIPLVTFCFITTISAHCSSFYISQRWNMHHYSCIAILERWGWRYNPTNLSILQCAHEEFLCKYLVSRQLFVLNLYGRLRSKVNVSLNLCCLELVKNLPLYSVTVSVSPWHSRMSLRSLVLHLILMLIWLPKVLLCPTPNISLGWMDAWMDGWMGYPLWSSVWSP